MKKIIFSQNFDLLALCLSAALQERDHPLQKQWILVPSVFLKQWLLTELAKKSPSKGIAGCKICTLEEIFTARFSQMPNPFEMRCLIYEALSQAWSSEVSAFISRFKKNRIELAEHLSSLFFSYGKYGLPSLKDEWQIRLFNTLFENSPFRLPIHFLENEKWEGETLHCFGFDSLPPLFWTFLQSAPSSLFYTFSPCYHFWEDLLTDQEQKNLISRRKKQGVPLDSLMQMNAYFSLAPPLLANLGKLGRKTMEAFDIHSFDVEFGYAPLSKKTLLHSIQAEILSFEKGLDERPSDDSIEVFQAGSSLLGEVSFMSEEILHLVSNKGLKFSDICVFAPDIERFASFLEFVFSQKGIPYRFPRISVEKKSSFYQGIHQLIDLVKSGWTREKIAAFFETHAFFHKAKFDRQEVVLCTRWISEAFQYASDWEEGFANWLRSSLTLFPGPKGEIEYLSQFDLLEKCFSLIQSLHEDCLALKEDRSLLDWALKWEEVVEKYLSYDSQDEIDLAAKESWDSALRQMKGSSLQGVYPLEVIEDILLKPIYSTIHGNHLHAVCCLSLEEGSVVPFKAIFMLGMDEESFPRKKQLSSLDLSKQGPDPSDVDRYSFLQVLLQAQEFLRISYCHVSSEDGGAVNPSILVQELMREASISPRIPDRGERRKKQKEALFSLKSPPLKIPGKARVLSLSDLTSFSRHPWKYYLQKVEKIFLSDRKELSFGAIRSGLLRSSLQWPLDSVFRSKKEKLPGLFNDAFFLDLQEKNEEIQDQLIQWGKKVCSFAFLETAREPFEFSPLQIQLDDGAIVSLQGEVLALEDGALHLGEDKISSLLRAWPEILAVLTALGTSNVYFLKSGKIKTIEDPRGALKRFVEYYLRCEESLSPLIPDWADVLLRKGPEDFDGAFAYEDAVNEWIFPRLDPPKAEALFEEWGWLKHSFEGLISLYPSRGKNENV